MAGPILGTALLVGILIGVLQAATSVQEMTLSFIPKLGAMILAMALFGGWQLNVLTEFFGIFLIAFQPYLYDGTSSYRSCETLL